VRGGDASSAEGRWNSIAALTARDFESIRVLVRDTCGIHLQQGKRALVSSRLERLVRQYRLDSFAAYIEFVSQRRSAPEFTEFIDTLTTNHSSFWREPEHFDFLRTEVFAKNPRAVIWSAACATGEEPYTVAMCALADGVPQCRVAASDISQTALNTARRGEYDDPRLATLPGGWAQRFFRPGSVPGMKSVQPEVRSLVAFATVNLLQPFRQVGQFDAILCRNVMIYFDQPTREHLVSRLAEQLHPGGYLLTGHSETLLALPRGLQYARPATYQRV
jgi:chemotaxis protein methyltransferase CheR